jgi:hypothetical protein
MEYTTLLNKIQTNLNAISPIGSSNTSKPARDSVDIILNKIGLEVQRQGGN